MTLSEVEVKSGITASTISKIEKGTMSPSDANLIRLSKGLGVDIVELVSEDSNQVLKTRRSITRFGDGPLHSIGTHDYRLLCSDIMSKKCNRCAPKFTRRVCTSSRPHPINRVRVARFSPTKAKKFSSFIPAKSSCIPNYAPLRLCAGDCAHIDSTISHICLRGPDEDAYVFCVCSNGKDIPWG